ncbi:hypothetical protein IAT40_004698 [Kwoniella sp. CBS 6097]
MTMTIMDPNVPLPASQTKHLPHLSHPLPKHPHIHLPLRQISSSASSSTSSTVSDSSLAANTPETGVQSTGTTGTTLWLSAQILSLYLSTISPPASSAPSFSTSTLTSSTPSTPKHGSPAPNPKPTPTSTSTGNVLELGGGIGYTALTLASAGWKVTTTDIEPVLSSVLSPNVEHGRRVLSSHGLGGQVVARGLDWFEMSEEWKKLSSSSAAPSPYGQVQGQGQGQRSDNEVMNSKYSSVSVSVTTQTQSQSHNSDNNADTDTETDTPHDDDKLSWVLDTKWDMVVMTDTFYAPQLIDPLWETLLLLSHQRQCPSSTSTSTSTQNHALNQTLPKTPTPPTIYIALERRDPRLITQALERGKTLGFDLKKINRSRLAKEVVKKYGWADEDWDGVEIWKCRYKAQGPSRSDIPKIIDS